MSKIYIHKKNDFAILGLVCSIFMGLPGLIFSIIGLSQIKKTGQEGKGMCIAGIIISILRAVLGISLFILILLMPIFNSSINDNYGNMTDYEKCTSIYTECDDYSWVCEEDGCWCTYDDGNQYDYFWCDSWDFDY